MFTRLVNMFHVKQLLPSWFYVSIDSLIHWLTIWSFIVLQISYKTFFFAFSLNASQNNVNRWKETKRKDEGNNWMRKMRRLIWKINYFKSMANIYFCASVTVYVYYLADEIFSLLEEVIKNDSNSISKI